jgi:high-affinity Fe2+/Pb2+ permease
LLGAEPPILDNNIRDIVMDVKNWRIKHKVNKKQTKQKEQANKRKNQKQKNKQNKEKSNKKIEK